MVVKYRINFDMYWVFFLANATIFSDYLISNRHSFFIFTEYKHIGYDILGQFYSEFIRYVNGDKKLGLVLTPPHITELFVELANLKVNDILYDN